ncbi:MAG: hypothetical protein IKN54_02680 [Lachnospiraceae bacterium]|nr:hypothetical protein [Lachnospiraceae bacterium]
MIRLINNYVRINNLYVVNHYASNRHNITDVKVYIRNKIKNAMFLSSCCFL